MTTLFGTAIKFTVFGKPVSLKNSRNIAGFRNPETGKTRRIPVKSAKLLGFERAFLAQVPASAKQCLTADVAVTIDAYYPDRRSDLSLEAVYDLLETAGVIKNDRQVKRKIENWNLDRANPRLEIEIEEMG